MMVRKGKREREREVCFSRGVTKEFYERWMSQSKVRLQKTHSPNVRLSSWVFLDVLISVMITFSSCNM